MVIICDVNRFMEKELPFSYRTISRRHRSQRKHATVNRIRAGFLGLQARGAARLTGAACGGENCGAAAHRAAGSAAGVLLSAEGELDPVGAVPSIPPTTGRNRPDRVGGRHVFR